MVLQLTKFLLIGRLPVLYLKVRSLISLTRLLNKNILVACRNIHFSGNFLVYNAFKDFSYFRNFKNIKDIDI